MIYAFSSVDKREGGMYVVQSRGEEKTAGDSVVDHDYVLLLCPVGITDGLMIK